MRMGCLDDWLSFLVFGVVYAINFFRSRVKRIETGLVRHVANQQKEDGNANGQADYVNGGERLIPDKISECGNKIMFKHNNL